MLKVHLFSKNYSLTNFHMPCAVYKVYNGTHKQINEEQNVEI